MRTQQAEIADQIEWGTHNKQTSMLEMTKRAGRSAGCYQVDSSWTHAEKKRWHERLIVWLQKYMRRYITKSATVLSPPLLYHYHSYHDWHDLEPTARSDSWRSPECNTTVIFINVINVINIIVIITTMVFILIINFTRQKPAYGQKGLAGGSLRASGAQLGSGKWWFFLTDTHTNNES